MVIAISFQSQMNPKDPDSKSTQTKFFEVDTMPEKAIVVGKLKEMGCDFDEEVVSIKIHHQDAAVMRNGGIPVPRIYRNR